MHVHVCVRAELVFVFVPPIALRVQGDAPLVTYAEVLGVVSTPVSELLRRVGDAVLKRLCKARA